MYNIIIKDARKPELFVIVHGSNEIRRLAQFFNRDDAEEVCRIIRNFRMDSSFEYCRVEKQ
jgi:hypothetical protein